MLLRKQYEDLLLSFPTEYWMLLMVCTHSVTDMLIPALRFFQTKAEVPMLSGSLLARAQPHTGPQLGIQKELLCAQM